MDYINLASGAAYFPTAEIVQQAAIAAIQQGQTTYGPTEGLPELRQAIGDRYRALNQSVVAPEKIIVTAGVKQAIFNLFRTVLQPGDEVIAPVANWFGFHELIEEVRAKLIVLPTSPADNYTINPEVLEKLITPKTKAFILCNPGNPTGRIYNKADLAAILQVLEAHPNVLVLSDEIYDLVTFKNQVPSLVEFPDNYNRYVVVNGFSKSFAMSGWRIGYLIVPEQFYQACFKFQQNTIGGLSPFTQKAAAVALQNYHEVLAPMRKVLTQNREIMCSGLRQIGNISFNEPEGTYYVFADLSAYLNKKCPETGETIDTSIELSKFLKNKFGLEIFAGDYFGAPGFARISFAVEPNQLQEALKRLQQGLHSLS
ncbi:aminotransferase class I/II-fold pyridoxal phosphate-dependent enzyme [Adhaeribacter swui]|uniref:Aminotransferase n=1 Tax=Adhaeribacter swui TaxID=2086471 RepID=A0A7G7GBN2_9BACT|nr:aminotransferase class I/II-fold pyridoxal phosphate-dependent enzyme [Adhaeribacter swui]QNF34566.1 aminotransferase class I/II-fold pyridoxal phosphate-dependent enzyme [Adhaeribacter swui]